MKETNVVCPTPKQLELLTCPGNQILFGGARGGGKSFGMILDFINHFNKYGKDGNVRGLMLRKSLREMEQLISETKRLFTVIGFNYNEHKKTFTDLKGNTFIFGYCANDTDAENYQGSAYTWMGIDECGGWKGRLDHGTPICERFKNLTATLRSMKDPKIQIRMIVTANPGGKGSPWIMRNWHMEDRANVPTGKIITEDGFKKCFIPAVIDDNPYNLNDPNYQKRLEASGGRALVAAWKHGDWWTNIEGKFFNAENFEEFEVEENGLPKLAEGETVKLRFITADTAYKTAQENDYTVLIAYLKTNINLYILDVSKKKMEFPDLKKEVVRFQRKWNSDMVQVEDKASGQSLVQELKAGTNIAIKGMKVKGGLTERGQFCLPTVEALKVKVPPKDNAPWLNDFIDEVNAFPEGVHDDIVSALILGIEEFKRNSMDEYLNEMEKMYGIKKNAV